MVKYVLLLLLATWSIASAVAEDKLIIYDPLGGDSLDPMEYATALTSGGELPQLWEPCLCFDEYYCICCMGMKYGADVKQELCVEFYYYAPDFLVEFVLVHNGQVKLSLNFNKYAPPPLCLPILLPIPVMPCVQLYNTVATDELLQLCLRVDLYQLFGTTSSYFFDCVRLSFSGFEFVSPFVADDLDISNFMW